MGKNLLVGVGSKARKVKALYVGVGGKARKVKKVYVGVGGKARLVYASYVAVKGIDISYEILSRYTLVVHATVTPGNATDRRICYTSSANNSSLIRYSRPSSSAAYHPTEKGFENPKSYPRHIFQCAGIRNGRITWVHRWSS